MNRTSQLPTIKKGIYRHYKNKKLYEVIGIAAHTETDEPMVIYKPLYESEFELFVRPYGIFIGSVDINGQIVPRFKMIKP